MRCDFEAIGDSKIRCVACGRTLKASRPPYEVFARCRSQRHAPLAPAWERKHREAICLTCEQYMPIGRCKRVGMGCRNTLHRLTRSAENTCPLGRWPEPRVRWVRTADLVNDASVLCDRLPADLAGVVGIPRSGLLPATVIATKRHLPLWTVRDGQLVAAGGGYRMDNYKPRAGRLLLVDDTVARGRTLARLAGAGLGIDKMVVAAIYVSPGSESKVDVYHATLPPPHLLEWNIWHSPYAQHLAYDLDGIICHNPPRQDDPRWLPCKFPPTIITARPEAERSATEAWLTRYGVQWRELIMWPGSAGDRSAAKVGQWKARQVLSLPSDQAEFYIESEPGVADVIRKYHVRVLCPEQGYLA